MRVAVITLWLIAFYEAWRGDRQLKQRCWMKEGP